MKKSCVFGVALCLCVLLCMPASAAYASDAPERRIFDDTDVLLVGGKNIIGSTGPEIYAALGASASREFLYYEGASGDGMVVWKYDGMEITLRTSDPDLCGAMTDLSTIPYEEESLHAFDVVVTKAGISGPRGIEVGMMLADVLAGLPMTDDLPAYWEGELILYRNPLSSDEEEAYGMSCLPPCGVLSSDGYAPDPLLGAFDVMLHLNYVDPSFYTEMMPEQQWEPSDYIYYTQYIMSVYAQDGTVVGYTLYQGATAE